MKRKRTKQKNKFVGIFAFVIFLAVLTVCFKAGERFVFPKENQQAGNNAESAVFEEESQNGGISAVDIAKEQGGNESEEEFVNRIMENMSLEDMIYQMMFVTPESITNIGTVIRAGDTTKKALEKYPIGGIVYFSKNFENREQTLEMISNTQKYSEIPLFIGVDEEGGRVARLGDNPDMGTTKQPAMRTIGESKEPQKAYEAGKIMGSELSELGFNVDFAPDADVIINDKNEEIGDRSFGTDAELVAEMVQNVVKGLQDNGVSATLKHFPGHGSTYTDSHTGYSESARTLAELRTKEFLPFKAGIEAGADFVMISHMTLVNATEEKVPSSISKEVITDMLINELGYEKIIITDSFAMKAITEEYTVEKAAVKAVKAGADMILMPEDPGAVNKAVAEAVEKGEITKERIEESVRKILLLKVRKNMIR